MSWPCRVAELETPDKMTSQVNYQSLTATHWEMLQYKSRVYSVNHGRSFLQTITSIKNLVFDFFWFYILHFELSLLGSNLNLRLKGLCTEFSYALRQFLQHLFSPVKILNVYFILMFSRSFHIQTFNVIFIDLNHNHKNNTGRVEESQRPDWNFSPLSHCVYILNCYVYSLSSSLGTSKSLRITYDVQIQRIFFFLWPCFFISGIIINLKIFLKNWREESYGRTRILSTCLIFWLISTFIYAYKQKICKQ